MRHAVDEQGLGWILFEDPALRVNLLNSSTLAALRGALDALAEAPVSAVIVASRKPGIFLAGADLKWLAAAADVPAATEISRKGQRLFEALESLPVPTVCAIDGVCAGGGLELALACQWRIASDSPSTRIGLPEVGLGTIPGWGGCVRLPRLIGVSAALDHILKAQLVGPTDALQVGIVDEVVAAEQLLDRAREAALRFAETGACVRLAPQSPPARLFEDRKKALADERRGAVLAPIAAIEVIERSSRLQVRPAYEIEAEAFGKATASPSCKALIDAFFLRG